MATPDFAEQTKALDATLTSIEKVLDLDAIRAEIETLQEEVGDPGLWDDQANAQRVTSRLSALQAEVERVTGLRERLDDLEIMTNSSRLAFLIAASTPTPWSSSWFHR